MARGADVLGILRGCGERADDFHRTRSKPDGSPAIAAVRAALADAGLAEDAIDYVNAHGTSTPENDKMEHLSLSTVFGERMRNIPISSNKSMIGHTLSAAGAVEAAFSLMTMREGVIPPTINYDNPDPAIELDVVPNVQARRRRRRPCCPIPSASAARTPALSWRGNRSKRPQRSLMPRTSSREPMRALQLVEDRRLETVDVRAAAAAGARRGDAAHQGRRAQPYRRLGLARHGVRQAQAAADDRRRGLRRGRGDRPRRRRPGAGPAGLDLRRAHLRALPRLPRRPRQSLRERRRACTASTSTASRRRRSTCRRGCWCPAPPGVDAIGAAVAPVTFGTVEHMLFDNARLEPGETILVHAGGSGIGIGGDPARQEAWAAR